MNLHLRFFASLREALGASSESISVPPEIATVGALREHLQLRGGAWSEALAAHKVVRTACNQVMVGAAAPLVEGCEVAFFPPVTGG